jgi:hypothetical protein
MNDNIKNKKINDEYKSSLDDDSQNNVPTAETDENNVKYEDLINVDYDENYEFERDYSNYNSYDNKYSFIFEEPKTDDDLLIFGKQEVFNENYETEQSTDTSKFN